MRHMRALFSSYVLEGPRSQYVLAHVLGHTHIMVYLCLYAWVAPVRICFSLSICLLFLYIYQSSCLYCQNQFACLSAFEPLSPSDSADLSLCLIRLSLRQDQINMFRRNSVFTLTLMITPKLVLLDAHSPKCVLCHTKFI